MVLNWITFVVDSECKAGIPLPSRRANDTSERALTDVFDRLHSQPFCLTFERFPWTELCVFCWLSIGSIRRTIDLCQRLIGSIARSICFYWRLIGSIARTNGFCWFWTDSISRTIILCWLLVGFIVRTTCVCCLFTGDEAGAMKQWDAKTPVLLVRLTKFVKHNVFTVVWGAILLPDSHTHTRCTY